MRVEVDQELCISCGLCIETCPEVFDWNEEGKATSIVEEVPSEFEEPAHEAVDNCPTDAITEE